MILFSVKRESVFFLSQNMKNRNNTWSDRTRKLSIIYPFMKLFINCFTLINALYIFIGPVNASSRLPQADEEFQESDLIVEGFFKSNENWYRIYTFEISTILKGKSPQNEIDVIVEAYAGDGEPRPKSE